MLKGRLGNQMFQYAAGRALAERHETELVLDTSWMVEYRRGGGVVENELVCFELDGREVRPVWEVARRAESPRAGCTRSSVCVRAAAASSCR